VKNQSCIAENILDAIKQHVPDVQLESNVGAELSFSLPKEQSATFETLFGDLEQNRDSLGIDSFGISVTTMEEVFLKQVFVLTLVVYRLPATGSRSPGIACRQCSMIDWHVAYN